MRLVLADAQHPARSGSAGRAAPAGLAARRIQLLLAVGFVRHRRAAAARSRCRSCRCGAGPRLPWKDCTDGDGRRCRSTRWASVEVADLAQPGLEFPHPSRSGRRRTSGCGAPGRGSRSGSATGWPRGSAVPPPGLPSSAEADAAGRAVATAGSGAPPRRPRPRSCSPPSAWPARVRRRPPRPPCAPSARVCPSVCVPSRPPGSPVAARSRVTRHMTRRTTCHMARPAVRISHGTDSRPARLPNRAHDGRHVSGRPDTRCEQGPSAGPPQAVPHAARVRRDACYR